MTAYICMRACLSEHSLIAYTIPALPISSMVEWSHLDLEVPDLSLMQLLFCVEHDL